MVENFVCERCWAVVPDATGLVTEATIKAAGQPGVICRHCAGVFELEKPVPLRTIRDGSAKLLFERVFDLIDAPNDEPGPFPSANVVRVTRREGGTDSRPVFLDLGRLWVDLDANGRLGAGVRLPGSQNYAADGARREIVRAGERAGLFEKWAKHGV